MDLLRRILRQTTTGPDNQTFDIVRIAGGLMALQFLANSLWAVIVKNHDFDPTSYGTGAAAMLTALGAAMRIARPVSDKGESQ